MPSCFPLFAKYVLSLSTLSIAVAQTEKVIEPIPAAPAEPGSQ